MSMRTRTATLCHLTDIQIHGRTITRTTQDITGYQVRLVPLQGTAYPTILTISANVKRLIKHSAVSTVRVRQQKCQKGGELQAISEDTFEVMKNHPILDVNRASRKGTNMLTMIIRQNILQSFHSTTKTGSSDNSEVRALCSRQPPCKGGFNQQASNSAVVMGHEAQLRSKIIQIMWEHNPPLIHDIGKLSLQQYRSMLKNNQVQDINIQFQITNAHNSKCSCAGNMKRKKNISPLRIH